MPQEGAQIENFALPDDTPGCATEARGIRDVYDQMLEKNALVFGVSAG